MFSENSGLDRSGQKTDFHQPYTNINIRSSAVVETDINCEEIEAEEFSHLNAIQRKNYNTSNQNFFEAKPKSANTMNHSKQNVRH